MKNESKNKSVAFIFLFSVDICGFTSTHSVDSGTKLLEKSWTLSYSGVTHGERRREGVEILTSPWLSNSMF